MNRFTDAHWMCFCIYIRQFNVYYIYSFLEDVILIDKSRYNIEESTKN